MATLKKVGKIPYNARIDIHYKEDGSKPTVRFSSTSKDPHKDARDQNYGGPILLILMGLFLLFFLGFYLYTSFNQVDNPKFCKVYVDDYHWFNPKNLSQRTDVVYGYNFTCDNGKYYVKWSGGELAMLPGFIADTRKQIGGSDAYYLMESLKPLRPILLGFVLLILSNIIIVRIVVKMKWYQHWIPRWNAKGNFNKKYWKFRAEDVENNLVEIPKFGNVMLEYKTEGDFSKYLTNIKIREHQWYKYNYKKRRTYGKKVVDAYKWYARFFFSQPPKTGYLEVIYR